MDPHGLPGPRLGELDAAAAAGLWALLAELRRGEVTPRGQLIRLARRLPVQLAAQLLSVRVVVRCRDQVGLAPMSTTRGGHAA